MQTYYQKHRQIQGFQFDGTIEQLLNELPQWCALFFNHDNVIQYDVKHRIQTIQKTANSFNDVIGYWPMQSFKVKSYQHRPMYRHRSVNFSSRDHRGSIYRSFNCGDYLTIHYRLSNMFDVFNKGELLSNKIPQDADEQVSSAYQRKLHENPHLSKWGGVKHIGPEKDKRLITEFYKYFRIWSPRDFESHWSKTPIKGAD